MDTLKKALVTLPLALGLVALGWFLYAGIGRMAQKDRQVVVRGLAEREVMADKVTWPLVIKTVGNDLQELYNEVSRKNSVVVSFLKSNGITEEEISVSAPQVFDKDAQTYRNDAPYRYNVTQVITVASGQVEKVNSLMRSQMELMKKGVTLNQDYEYRTVYEYTSLNDIKPEMTAQATRSAREAADKFAQDSHSKVGSIKTASQGQFSITDRDSFTPWIKNVRVVTTVTYYLQDR